MSSILKALRKVEEEKRVAKHAAPDLRSDQGAHARSKKNLGPLLTGMLLGAVCVSLILYAIPGDEEPAAVPTVVQEERAVVPTPAPESEPAPVRAARETIPIVVMPPEPVSVGSAAPEIKKPVETLREKAIARSPTNQPASETRPEPAPAAVIKTDEPETSLLPENVTLQVTEIFYQPDPADRMAVVNDLPVMVGTSVDGVLVSEIHSNHVLFTIDGENYPVYLPAQ